LSEQIRTGGKRMSLPLIILTGLLLAAAGSAILLLLPPVFRLPWKTTVKRCIWFTVGLEAAVAAVFCIFNGVRPTVAGQMAWYIARFFQICILGVLDAQIMKKYRSQGMTALYVIAGSLLAQALQYGIIRLIY
jgi:hypothetical protein